MLLSFAAGATGILLGLCFRVQALIVASCAMFILCLVIAPFAGLGLLSTAGMMLLLLGLLQAGYLSGLMISHVCSRAGMPRPRCHQVQAVARAIKSCPWAR
jgi:hypothetical protein